MNIGQYVSYKNKPYLVVHVTPDGKIRILDPATNVELQVKPDNLRVLPYQAKLVSYKDIDYFVTKLGMIVSTIAYRVVWTQDTPTRTAILELAGLT
jgi:hypothetical protein